MPPDGYSGVTRLEDTDFNGTLAVIINNKRFQNKMAAQLNQSNNVCIQAREVGRLIRHSPDLNLTDSELMQYIDIFMDLLSDLKYLVADRKAQEAVDKLNQLKLNTLTITTADITTVLNSAIKEKQQDALEAIKEDTKEAIECIQEKAKASIQHLMNVKDSITNVKTFTCASLNRITASKRSSISEIKCEAKKQKQEIEKTGAKEREKLKQVAGELPQREIKIQATHTTSRREELEENMREDLIKFYRKYYSNIPVSPLVEEHDVPLTDFYVHPPLTSIDMQRKFGQCQDFPKKASIHSYRDVFLRGDGELYKDIYITANAGVGKTSFAKKICMTWCQAHRPTEMVEQTFKSEDINSMKTFEFLFMVSLRDVDTSICDLDNMIESSILHYLARFSRFSRLDLEDILNERACLVLLDGLDEWAHPTSCVRGRRDVHATPHIPARERCTVLTTTRPWKLDVIKLGTSQIDRHIEINELDETSTKELTSNAITVLNRQSLPDQPKTVEDFESATSTLKLDNLRYIPYILLQMICLWFDGKSIGRTKCEIYTNIITLTLSRGLLKIDNKGLPPMRGQNLETTYEIPHCLKSNNICKSHYEVLIGLALLAFKKLFSPKAESNLVFDRSEVLQVI
ncbi:uncharacterized protein LOC123526329 [Mercenaria mercenaria]|uniref:uncharacterized protein LOC123526329 n=1 Tax=Mercenaria mercenaria TaxID=6596 RepID=UPI00234EBD82|nr:uncharacterized protein LOC123526329 [Mercenaria mercenaria]